MSSEVENIELKTICFQPFCLKAEGVTPLIFLKNLVRCACDEKPKVLAISCTVCVVVESSRSISFTMYSSMIAFGVLPEMRRVTCAR